MERVVFLVFLVVVIVNVRVDTVGPGNIVILVDVAVTAWTWLHVLLALGLVLHSDRDASIGMDPRHSRDPSLCYGLVGVNLEVNFSGLGGEDRITCHHVHLGHVTETISEGLLSTTLCRPILDLLEVKLV